MQLFGGFDTDSYVFFSDFFYLFYLLLALDNFGDYSIKKTYISLRNVNV